MTAKEFVLTHYPKARAERHKGNGPFAESYWLIRDGKQWMYMADGKTESNAWVKAKRLVVEKLNSDKNAQASVATESDSSTIADNQK
jgi:hypothetical protein